MRPNSSHQGGNLFLADAARATPTSPGITNTASRVRQMHWHAWSDLCFRLSKAPSYVIMGSIINPTSMSPSRESGTLVKVIKLFFEHNPCSWSAPDMTCLLNYYTRRSGRCPSRVGYYLVSTLMARVRSLVILTSLVGTWLASKVIKQRILWSQYTTAH